MFFFILQWLIKKKKLSHFCLTFQHLVFIKSNFTTHNKLIFFYRFVAILFLSYKLITNKISVELIKHSNATITFKLIYILSVIICIRLCIKKVITQFVSSVLSPKGASILSILIQQFSLLCGSEDCLINQTNANIFFKTVMVICKEVFMEKLLFYFFTSQKCLVTIFIVVPSQRKLINCSTSILFATNFAS